MSQKQIDRQRVLIVGAGFAGTKAALELGEDDRLDVTLLDDDDELRYYPTLYHTATGGKRANSSIPLAQILAGKNVTLAKGIAVSLDRKQKVIKTQDKKSYPYDVLVLGLGVVTNYFGIQGLKEYSFSIKSQDEVARFKRHLHEQLQNDHKPDPHYVIVGAGPTGIELAGSLPKYIKYIMKQHGVRPRKVHVDLIESAPRLLPRLPKRTSRVVRRRLKRLGVRLYLGRTVEGASADELMVSGRPIRSHTVVWTAGVTNNPFFRDNNFVLMGRGKVAVDAYLQAEDNVFVIGDNANTPFSGLAQTALYDGEFVAKNIRRRVSGKRLKNYNPRLPVTVIPAGPYWAAVDWNGWRLHGRLGRLLREAADLIGFHDLQPWPKAAKQYMTGLEAEDNCPTCALANAKG